MMDQSKNISEIQRFYDGQVVFITGGTGFMGKIVIEKLLRSCPGIKKIYLLVRPKNNKNVQERIDSLLSSSIFRVLSEVYPNYREKVVGIKGDVYEPNLGISSEDRVLLVKEVTIIFHVAATIRFDEPLLVAININVRSVKDIIELSKECKHFKVGVYVSTAYSYCIQSKIQEVVYDSPLTYEDCMALTKIILRKNWSEKDLTDVTNKIIGKWPNTYTFTKAIAETVVAEYAKNMPFSIIRPSIVVATNKEPEPGWIDNLLGPGGLMVGVGYGIIHTALVDYSARCDVIPCDMACIAIIACAWETGVKYKGPGRKIPVYNCVNQHAITWGRFCNTALDCLYDNPSSHIVYYPCIMDTVSPVLFTFYQFFFQMIPAFIYDCVLKFKGKKMFMYDTYKKGMTFVKVLSFFTLQQWDFESNMLNNMWKNMNEKDKELFPFISNTFTWRKFFITYDVTLKQLFENYLLKHKYIKAQPDNLHNARRHLRKLYMIHQIIRLLFFIFVLWLMWKIFFSLIFFIVM